MNDISSNFKITSRRCKVCMSPLRDQIDLLLLGETTHEDGQIWKYSEIVDWCQAHGLIISEASLSRHRSGHLMPAVQAAVETQKAMDAIANATGKKLSLHSAVVNVIATKALRLLDQADLEDVDIDKVLRLAVQAARVSLQIEKVEHYLSKETAQEVSSKLAHNGVPEHVIRQIEEEVLGLRR